MTGKAGRPPKYPDAAELEAKVEEYFALCEERDKRPGMAGISYFLGFANVESFTDHVTRGEDFARIVRRARLRIESWLEERLHDKGVSTVGLIFDLKCNYGWRDKQEVELTGPNGGPIQQAHTHSIDTSNLDDDQLRALASIKV